MRFVYTKLISLSFFNFFKKNFTFKKHESLKEKLSNGCFDSTLSKEDDNLKENVIIDEKNNLKKLLKSHSSRSSSKTSLNSSQALMCRICHCEEASEEYLISPCYCTGTLRYVHQACLQQWLKSNGMKSCELCKFDFIMQTKIRPFKNWQKLDMSRIEKRKLMCSVAFHIIAITCVIWSLYVLIDRTAEEIRNGSLHWPFWTKLVVVAIGFTGGIVFMYIQCKMYLQLCIRWKQYNRVIIIQPISEELLKKPKKMSLKEQQQIAPKIMQAFRFNRINNNKTNNSHVVVNTLAVVNNNNSNINNSTNAATTGSVATAVLATVSSDNANSNLNTTTTTVINLNNSGNTDQQQQQLSDENNNYISVRLND